MSSMVEDTTYEGWKNYPTWAVNLWLANDRGLYDQTLIMVTEAFDQSNANRNENVREGIWTQGEAQRFYLADALKDWFEEYGVEIISSGDDKTAAYGQLTGVHADLYSYALGEVDWQEIADAWIQNYRESEMYREATAPDVDE